MKYFSYLWFTAYLIFGLNEPRDLIINTLLEFQALENAIKVPFQAPEIVYFWLFKAPENSKKVLPYFRPLKMP
jgi:hypothetical protein